MKKYIDRLIIKFFDFVYKKQNERHQKRMESLKKSISTASYNGEKHSMNSAATLTINNSSNHEKKANQEKIKEILDNALKSEDGLFKYIEKSTTPIYKIKFADKILAKINETEGFILPKKGLKALYLNLILNHKISFKTPEMFVLRDYNVNIYAFIYQFYNWYCYKMSLDGFSPSAQEQFKNVFEICETDKINTLTFEEIMELKGAIKQDVEAIDFVINYVKEKVKAKECLDKIKDGKSINL